MNKEESLALFTQGRDAWNAWAAKMFTEREALEAAGTWMAGREQSELNDATRPWHAEAMADFSEYQFGDTADFSGFVFPGTAWFGDATFSGDVQFGEATFSGNVVFSKATFSSNTVFDGVTFLGNAGFGDANFSGNTWFGGATFSGDAEFTKATFSGNAWFGNSTFSGDAEFAKAMFLGHAWFREVTFLGYAVFNEATFPGVAVFDKATFSGTAWFGDANFPGDAVFDQTTFSGNVVFSKARFSGNAGFSKATISGNAWFLQAVFEGFTVFDNVRFEKAVDFRAIDSKSVFTLAGATFLTVPNFIQAHFAEAPRFDDSRIEPRNIKRDPNLSARWRSLKRLAIQGHDHERELAFFKGELKSRRWSVDKPWNAVFWFGLLYQWLSDFGRSLVRPLLWWAASIAVFTRLYLEEHLGRALHPGSCVVGPGEPWVAALSLSLRKGLLFIGLDGTDKLNQLYGCLYGIFPDKPVKLGQFPEAFSPIVPDVVAFVGLVQLLFSAVLIFLFLLALRNHFRIK